jgi:hypothetical protein
LKWAATILTLVAALAPTRARADGPSFDFELDGSASQESAAARSARVAEVETKARLRRRMLTAHQAFGFATLALLASTVVIGHLNYHDLYESEASGRFATPHLVLASTTTLAFTTTGMLALFAPNPYPKKIGLDTALLHKVSMALATAGMLAQVVLGPIASFRQGNLDQRQLAQTHLGIGYATFAFMATGVIAYVF